MASESSFEVWWDCNLLMLNVLVQKNSENGTKFETCRVVFDHQGKEQIHYTVSQKTRQL